MTRRAARHTLLIALTISLIALPAQSCGPDWPEAVFTKRYGPDEPYLAFAAGRLGVLQPGYRTHHLVIAYDYLTGHPLSVAAQKQAVRVNHGFVDPWQGYDKNGNPLPPSGLTAWTEARSRYSDDPTPDIRPDHNVPGENYTTFLNCLDPAFFTAAQTLAERVKSYGEHNPEVAEWLRGQDAVFSQCGGNFKPRPYGPAQPVPHDPVMPQALTKGSLWLQQDRAYQLAAASFYALDYDTAISRFRAIAADPASPWSLLSRYLVARTMIRKSSVADTLVYTSYRMTAQTAKHAASVDYMVQAQKELLAMRSEPRMASMRNTIDELLDLVNARIQPQKQSIVLASRLLASNQSHFSQSLTDLTIIRNSDDQELQKHPSDARAARNASQERDAVDMLDWIDTLQLSNPPEDSFYEHYDNTLTGAALDQAHAAFAKAQAEKKAAALVHTEDFSLHHWRATPTLPWLLAALIFAQPSDPAAPDLLAAAKDVPPTSSGFTATTYHRLRLQQLDSTTHADLLSVLPSINAHEGPSTRNLYAALNADTAPTLSEWLVQAGRTPAADEIYNSEENDPSSVYKDDEIVPGKHQKVLPLFTADAATILNTRTPLRLLVAAAENPSLAPSLRYQVAQAAWTRAVLLNRRDTALRMAPLLIRAHGQWQPVLDAYAQADDDDRRAAALFALMRFASTEPNVREGYPRVDGFAAYSYYRDNWWCSTVPPGDGQSTFDQGTWDALTTFAHPTTPDPLFLTPADRTEAAHEITALRSVPSAAEYLGNAALAWQKSHPHDVRTPELLGQALRVERNACGDSKIAHQLFLALHLHYPDNHWTKRYRSWD